MATLAEVRQQVRALQSGDAAAAQAAGRQLAQLQQTRAAVPLAAALLEEASAEGDDAAAFFAAHTLATHARLCVAEEGATAWPALAQRMLGVLEGSASGGSTRVAAPVLRQLCVALARLAVQLFDSWPGAVGGILARLGARPCLGPLLEVLQALAEEPFSRRLLVDGSHRSRFLLALRGEVSKVLQAIGRSAEAQPGVPVLRCATSWLRAQPAFEEWLPMVGFAGDGAHPALAASALVFSPLALRAARLELGLEAFEAAAALLEAAVPLAGDLATEWARSSIVGALLAAFAETCARLPKSASPQGSSALGVDLSEIVAVLLAVMHAAFSSPAPVANMTLHSDLLAMAAKLLVVSGPSGGLEVDCEGGLFGRGLDVWEALRITFRPTSNGCAELVMAPASKAEELLDTAFASLLSALPQALRLPSTLVEVPEDWNLPRMRARTAQLLTVWCDASEARTEAMMRMLRGLCVALPQALSGMDCAGGDACADWELVLTLGAAAAEAIAGTSDASAIPLPEPLGSLLRCLPNLLRPAPRAPWAALLEQAVAEFVVALDPWITPASCMDGVQPLLAFVFRLADSSCAPTAGAEAVAVVVSNLAGQLVARPEIGGECFAQLRKLILGGAHLPAAARERLLRSALSPLLSQLPEVQLRAAVEGLAADLRAAMLPASQEDSPTGERNTTTRLLFYLLAGPQATRPELALEWLSSHWQCFEAAVASPVAVESTTDAACHAMTAVLSRARSHPMAQQALQRAVPMLAAGAMHRGSAAALGALGNLVRIFRGGGDDEKVAKQLAAQVAELSQQLLGRDGGRIAEQRLAQLPPDLLAALLELFAASLAPRCTRLALELFSCHGLLPGVVTPVAAVLHSCASPRIVCWGLLFFERLPHWFGQAGFQPHASTVLEVTLPQMGMACCRLLASSPVAQDPEVCSASAKLLLSLARLLPGHTASALQQAASQCGVPLQEYELLLQQVADPLASEEGLAQALRDTADSWQVEHLRRLLAAS